MTGLDAEARSLLFEHVSGYDELEALLLLHAAPARAWTVVEVAAALRIAALDAAAALGELSAHRLLATENASAPERFRYAPADGALAAGVDRLAQAYAGQRLDVVKQMSANAIERLRSSAARAFADAFLLGKKKIDQGGQP